MRSCSKSGVKIHESENDNRMTQTQEDFYNKIKSQNRHTGVRVNEEGKNKYTLDPFEGANPFQQQQLTNKIELKQFNVDDLYKMDLCVDNYSMEDIYKLFGLVPNTSLTMDILKEVKKIVLKTHPDKSKLDAKYFLFFGQAFKRLHNMFEFQNKSSQTQETFIKKTSIQKDKQNRTYDSSSNEFPEELNESLNHFFGKNRKLDPVQSGSNFNQWFNEAFEKYNLKDESETVGYADWLKSDEGIQNFDNVSQANMASEMEKYKKQVQSLVTYNGVSAVNASFGTSLMPSSQDGFGSSSTYTDLRQAYEQSVIPVTMEDYNKIPKDRYRSIDAYKAHRNAVEREEMKPLNTHESMHMLYKTQNEEEKESAALAFYHATQLEKTKERLKGFWSNILNIENSDNQRG